MEGGANSGLIVTRPNKFVEAAFYNLAVDAAILELEVHVSAGWLQR